MSIKKLLLNNPFHAKSIYFSIDELVPINHPYLQFFSFIELAKQLNEYVS
jgi:hypothetical protein